MSNNALGGRTLYEATIFPTRKINRLMIIATGALMALIILLIGWFSDLFEQLAWSVGLALLALALALLAIFLFRRDRTQMRLIERENGEVDLVIGKNMRVQVWSLPLEYHFSYFTGLVGKRNMQYPVLLFTVMDEGGNCALAVQEDLAVQYRPPTRWLPTEQAILQQLPRVRNSFRNLFSRPSLERLKAYLDEM
ncbi:hypothetical protein [Lusitaniella coriacea]|uniref:hypothetical protein n=1 Tax=Lusitaniella coriacea TaxID=1983105 RepID=UPI003CE6B50A